MSVNIDFMFLAVACVCMGLQPEVGDAHAEGHRPCVGPGVIPVHACSLTPNPPMDRPPWSPMPWRVARDVADEVRRAR